jgi:hypothetical protein
MQFATVPETSIGISRVGVDRQSSGARVHGTAAATPGRGFARGGMNQRLI